MITLTIYLPFSAKNFAWISLILLINIVMGQEKTSLALIPLNMDNDSLGINTVSSVIEGIEENLLRTNDFEIEVIKDQFKDKISMKNIKSIKNTLNNEYYVTIEVSKGEINEVIVRGDVYNFKNEEFILPIKVEGTAILAQGDDLSFEEYLARKFVENLLVLFKKKIRVVITNFNIYGDTTLFKDIDKAIPTMLGSGINLSQKIKLTYMNADSLKNALPQTHNDFLNYSDDTKPKEHPSLIHANYSITGNIYIIEDNIRIDAQYIDIETGLIELSIQKVVNKSDNMLLELSNRVNELARELRQAIESSFISRRHFVPSLAVIALRSYSEDNKLTVKIGRTISNKLKILQKNRFRIVENEQKMDEYFTDMPDKAQIGRELGVDNLLFIRYEGFGSQFIIDVELVDLRDPTKPTIFKSLEGDLRYMNDRIDQLVLHLLEQWRISLTEDELREFRNIKIRLFNYSIGLKGGANSIHDPSLYLQYTFESGMNWYGEFRASTYFPNKNFQLSVLLSRTKEIKVNTYDIEPFGGSENILLGEFSAWEMSLFLLFRYNFSPIKSINFYLGTGIGYSGINRKFKDLNSNLSSIEIYLRSMIIDFGGEISMTKHIFLDINTNFRKSFTKVPYFTVEIENLLYAFSTGYLRGFYLSLGFGYKW